MLHTLCGTCCGTNDVQSEELIETVAANKCLDPKRKRPLMVELVAALKSGGGPENGAGNEANYVFLKMLDDQFPELKLYCIGKIQTSPGVEEIEGSPTEYYRTIGAMIALLATWATHSGDDFGLDCVSKGNRGPMSMDKVPGKFINLGGKPAQYKEFCDTFAEGMQSEEDWWAMLVFLAVHDVGKSDAFRNAVNVTLPVSKRSDDHDRCLARALADIDMRQKFLPSVMRLSPKHQGMLAAGFATNFQLPQLGQGEVAVDNLRGLLDLRKEALSDGTLRNYLYHSIFDIAGASCNEKFIYPLGLAPVYVGFSTSLLDLLEKLQMASKPTEVAIYFEFLYSGFKKAYPEFEEQVFRPLCESKIFRTETGLAMLRILALTRNTYKNPQKVLDLLLQRLCTHPMLIQEMCGKPDPPGPQVMLYYAPDMLRMGLGEDLEDESGDNMHQALGALDDCYQLAREELKSVTTGDYQYQLNVQAVVTLIKNAGKAWKGGAQLREAVNGASVKSNAMKTEGMLLLRADSNATI